jgi:hypothetical protein
MLRAAARPLRQRRRRPSPLLALPYQERERLLAGVTRPAYVVDTGQAGERQPAAAPEAPRGSRGGAAGMSGAGVG